MWTCERFHLVWVCRQVLNARGCAHAQGEVLFIRSANGNLTIAPFLPAFDQLVLVVYSGSRTTGICARWSETRFLG